MTARGFQKVRKWPPGSCPLWINFHYNWWWQRIKRKNLNFLIPCPDIAHRLTILFSLLVFVLFITWSQFCMQFSWLFHDVLMTCTHGLFLTYTCLDHGLIMTCSWISTLIMFINFSRLVHDLFTTWSQLVHHLFIRACHHYLFSKFFIGTSFFGAFLCI